MGMGDRPRAMGERCESGLEEGRKRIGDFSFPFCLVFFHYYICS